jgi:hypothetical protein
VNFAVAGATALPREALEKFNLQPFINISLDIQLQWWGNYAKSLCNNSKGNYSHSIFSPLPPLFESVFHVVFRPV